MNYTVKVLIKYDGELGLEPGAVITKAKRNETMRDVIGLQVSDALKQYGLSTQVLEIRKVQNGTSSFNA